VAIGKKKNKKTCLLRLVLELHAATDGVKGQTVRQTENKFNITKI